MSTIQPLANDFVQLFESPDAARIWLGTWKTKHAELPPYGSFAKTPDGEPVVFSARAQGR